MDPNMIPSQQPNIPSQADGMLGNFFAAKDVMDRNPGGSKKKWPLVLAGILLAAVVLVFVLIFALAGGRITARSREKGVFCHGNRSSSWT